MRCAPARHVPHAPHVPTGRRDRPVTLLVMLAVAVIASACGPATDDVAALDVGADGEVDAPLNDDTSLDDDRDEADGSDGRAEPADRDEADGPTPAEPADAPGAEGASEDGGDQHTTTLSVGFEEDEVTVFATDGGELTSFGLTSERGERVTDVVVRPGASATDLDAAVVVLRGEVYRLYHLGVTEGQDAVFTPFPDHLQPQDVTEAVMTVTWTPDADSLVWTEPTGDGVVLRSIGWDGGPGTDRASDDNASFALELPADVSIDGFEVVGDHRWTVRMTDGMGTSHAVAMERQADGALTLPA